MPTYQVNLTDVAESKGGGGPLCPPGIYVFQVCDVECKTTKNGDPMVRVELQVLEDCDGSTAFKGAKVYDHITIPNVGSPAFSIMGLTKHFLHCIGEPYDGEVTIDPDNWVPRQCIVEVFHEPYTKPGTTEPKMYPKVKRYLLLEDVEEAKEPKPTISWAD